MVAQIKQGDRATWAITPHVSLMVFSLARGCFRGNRRGWNRRGEGLESKSFPLLAIADPNFDPTNPVAMVRQLVSPVLANVARDRWVTLVRQLVSPVPANPCSRTPLVTNPTIC